jgi:cytochrome c553
MACHGKEGRATPDGYFPRIAGKPAGYLYNQLVNFRDGRRTFPMMEYLVDRQSDAYLKELAEYFASQELPYAQPVPPNATEQALELGRRLVFDGDTSRRIPSCRSCHGTQLVGVAPAVPGLLGLSQDYLMAQMGAWQNGSRHALAPDCMADTARELAPQDIHAIASWLSTQVVPTGAKPASTFESPPPKHCGSIEQGSPAP